MKEIRIIHRPTRIVLAQGPLGWGITPFEGNLYIRHKYLRTRDLRPNFIPGFCPYKFLYVWMDLHAPDHRFKNVGWLYWLPNPIFPFIWYRVAIPRHHPDIQIDDVALNKPAL